MKFAGAHWPKIVGWTGTPSLVLLTLDNCPRKAKMKLNDAMLEDYQKSTMVGGTLH